MADHAAITAPVVPMTFMPAASRRSLVAGDRGNRLLGTVDVPAPFAARNSLAAFSKTMVEMWNNEPTLASARKLREQLFSPGGSIIAPS